MQRHFMVVSVLSLLVGWVSSTEEKVLSPVGDAELGDRWGGWASGCCRWKGIGSSRVDRGTFGSRDTHACSSDGFALLGGLEVACPTSTTGGVVRDALRTLGDILCTSDFDRIVFADVSCSASARGITGCVLWLYNQLVIVSDNEAGKKYRENRWRVS